VLLLLVCNAGQAQTPISTDKVIAAFSNADRDSDKRLTLDEFLVKRGDPKVVTRDFRLFDLDADGYLSRDEFATVPTVIAPEHRGPLPDPMLGLVEQAVAAMDASFGNWNERPNEEIDAQQFIAAAMTDLRNSGRGIPPNEVDSDGDGKVTRNEARRFLEIQLGVRRSDGKLLREPNGRVVNNHLYLHVDANKNDRLEREEYLARSYAGDKAEPEFTAGDSDGDGAITYDEWSRMPGRSFEDVIQQFRQYDTSFDGKLSPEELLTGSPDWKKQLATHVFPGFDLDKDGSLSLNEYRLTMQANMIAPWTSIRIDENDDGKLSFEEFRWDQAQHPLLRLVFFTRLDVNQDSFLDQNEFTFRVREPDQFMVMNADGTGWKSLYRFEGHPACGSVAVSPDGKQIAFDSWTSRQQQNSSIFVMDIDGSEPRQLRSGMMPAWAPDGKKLCYSWNNSIWITTSDGRQLRIATQGWGGQWSPDGKKIAFSLGNAIQTYDIESEQIETVLAAADNPYTSLFWNMGWSPDSSRLCFKGARGEMHDVASVRVGGKPHLKVHHTGTQNMNADFAWHPSGHRVVFAMYCPERARTQLYEFDPDANDPPKLVAGQNPNINNTDVCWTPDGKRLIVVCGDY
jgi:TolB protein